MATRNLGDAHPDLIEAFAAIKVEFERHFPSYELRPICVYRSPEEQRLVFREGKSQLDGVTKLSKHNRKPSHAIDAGIFFAGRYIDDDLSRGKFDKDLHRALYLIYGMLAESRSLRWGGRWKTLVDMPHIEIPT